MSGSVHVVELATLSGAIVADRVIGEWPNALHPVVWMGKAASWLERLAPARSPAVALGWGALITAIVPGTFAWASAWIVAQTKPHFILECGIGILLL